MISGGQRQGMYASYCCVPSAFGLARKQVEKARKKNRGLCRVFFSRTARANLQIPKRGVIYARCQSCVCQTACTGLRRALSMGPAVLYDWSRANAPENEVARRWVVNGIGVAVYDQLLDVSCDGDRRSSLAPGKVGRRCSTLLLAVCVVASKSW